MTSIWTSDIHMSEKEDRFFLFDWLIKQAKKYNANRIGINGDLTEEKDRHSSMLVNKLVRGIFSLREAGLQVDINMGNHDYIDPAYPFFDFLGNFDGVSYNTKICNLTVEISSPVMIGHTRDEGLFQKRLQEGISWGPKVIFIHQTFKGASLNGHLKLGVGFDLPTDVKVPIYSGDVHTPQTLGPVTYIGAPYHTRFGDDYEPRVLVFNDRYQITHQLKVPAPRKLSVTLGINDDPMKLAKVINNGDHVRVAVKMRRADYYKWEQIKDNIEESIKKIGGVCFGVGIEEIESNNVVRRRRPTAKDDPNTLLDMYAGKEGLDEFTTNIGRGILNGE